MLPELVLEKLASLPARSGCYVFRDREGKVLYVGKAKSLRTRVRSYFNEGGSDDRAFIPLLLGQIGDLETRVTGSEKEAAILENNLIKELAPRFNVKLRDDKEYLSLRLGSEHPWPRLELVRRPKADGAKYFGPYHSATSARRTLNLVEKHFKLRTCTDRELVSRRRPCLQYQIQRCAAPCVLDVDADAYAAQVRSVELFLAARHEELHRELETRMQKASAAMQFELAATYRDQLRAVRSVLEAQHVVSVTDRDQDVLGLYREGDLVELALLRVREGRVVDIASFSSPRVELPDDELIAGFLRENYAESRQGQAAIPDEVLVPVLPEGVDGVAEWLTEVRRAREPRSCRVAILASSRAPRRQLLEMARENAAHAFAEKRRAREDVEERLARVQRRLRLPRLPRRIECCDISHLGGQDTVGAVVALSDSVPDKARYRLYRLKQCEPGDDYGAMREVLARRFKRGREAAEAMEAPDSEWSLPDLFVVDGGRGQLGIALAAAADVGVGELPIVGLAKERERPGADKLVDRVYLPGQKNPVPLKTNGPELFILARARDEAHRFSNRGRAGLGKRRRLSSELDAVPGIGPKTRRALLRTFGSVAAVRSASVEAVLAVPGLTKRQAYALREHFAGSPTLEAADASEQPPEKEPTGN